MLVETSVPSSAEGEVASDDVSSIKLLKSVDAEGSPRDLKHDEDKGEVSK
jgi:hypothetical protein